MLKEADVSKKGLLAFRDCLSVVPSLTIDSIEELPAKDMPDYRATLQGEGFKQIVYLEIKTLGTPKSTREAVNLLVRRIQNEPASYGIFVAPYIAPRSAAICKESGIGYVDLSGNCSIAFQQIFINREKSGNFPSKRAYHRSTRQNLNVYYAFYSSTLIEPGRQSILRKKLKSALV